MQGIGVAEKLDGHIGGRKAQASANGTNNANGIVWFK